MPPRLELADSNHRLVMPPSRINLRRAKSYNAQEKGPLSATTSRFNFNHLLFSPPPSPSLPSLIPQKPKRTGSDLLLKSRPSRVFRWGLLATLLGAMTYIVSVCVRNQEGIQQAMWPYFEQKEYEMVGQDALPDFPTPIVLHDTRGRSKWTVSIPPDYDFPLPTEEYTAMTGQCREVAARARDITATADTFSQVYDTEDKYYVDVSKAEKLGLLDHGPKHVEPTKQKGHFVGLTHKNVAGRPVCESSMTYVLESTDAGMGNNLMTLWTFYGLAKEQGRAFFVDDSRWAYGDWTEIFEAPPLPECRPPPRHHIVPCPFHAQHLVVSGSTAKDIFPSMLAKHHRMVGAEDEVQALWKLAREGYQDLFKLTADDAKYVTKRIRELKVRSQKGITAPDAPVIGLHVRRGDRHPLEYQYSETYIPAEVFHASARQMAVAHANAARYQTEAHWRRNEPILLLASDDPMVHLESDFSAAVLSQERIRLASKDAIQQQAGPKQEPRFLHRFVDEAFGWEGGFYAPMFWNLGVSRKNNAANAPEGVDVGGAVNEEARLLAPPSEQTIKLRSLIGRAYMMDLAVLAGASDGVICAVSAMGCRLLGVMMEWDKGVGGAGWVNVDGAYGWTGIDW
ncbi:uncharacterized protein F5Z01DRAFT_440567 [Emericellopsis atlantica]|uniref:Uncharacterized protein n=1 Tax=Emericellopsis atlantica TaxID=2614577 RepID=A0A9P7ZD69_9HYPO|nr:uncharacterized protein F5Z01DRAFT_440567 [Emericellopsis atlantica]KAG9249865.1 hypothetical protein F5Z01DRAFT_440567 [Emericellopsis atlantica]